MTKPVIRLCLSFIKGCFDSPDGKTIVGPLSDLTNFYYINQFKDYNTSITSYPKLGTQIAELNDGSFSYDGCLGSNQKNETDYVIGIVPFPLMGQNLTNEAVSIDDFDIITSMYDPEQNLTECNSILGSLNSPVPTDMKITFLSFLFLFFLIFYIFLSSGVFRRGLHLRKRKTAFPKTNAINIIIGSLLRQYSCFESMIENKRMIIRPLVFLLVVFTFIFMHIVSSLIKTEQVAIHDPVTIQTYKTKAERKIMVNFIKTTTDYDSFKSANNKSMKRKIWEQMSSQEGGLEASFIGGNNSDSVGSFFSLIQKVANQSAVVLMTNIARQSIDTNVCAIMRLQGKAHNMLSKVDASEAKFEFKTTGRRVILESEGDLNKYKKADDLMKRFFQMGINTKNLELNGFKLLPEQEVKQVIGKVRDCLANEIVKQEPEVETKTFKEFTTLFLWYSVGMILWSIILSFELNY